MEEIHCQASTHYSSWILLRYSLLPTSKRAKMALVLCQKSDILSFGPTVWSNLHRFQPSSKHGGLQQAGVNSYDFGDKPLSQSSGFHVCTDPETIAHSLAKWVQLKGEGAVTDLSDPPPCHLTFKQLKQHFWMAIIGSGVWETLQEHKQLVGWNKTRISWGVQPVGQSKYKSVCNGWSAVSHLPNP